MKRRNTCESRQISFANPEIIEPSKEDDSDDNKSTRQRLRIRRLLKNGRAHFREYSEKSSLHGIQYIGEKGRPMLERICWLVIFAISIYMCMNFIMQTWNKWNTRPVIVSFAHKPTAVWQIPFPAITICSEIKSRQTVFNFTEQLTNNNKTDEERRKLEAVSLLCSSKRYKDGENFTDDSVLEILKSVAPTFDETFLKCLWYGFEVRCNILFTKILTAEGLCYTYNMLNASELFVKEMQHQALLNINEKATWSMESGYNTSVEYDKQYPERAYGVGNEGGIQIMLNTYDFDYDYSCRGPTQGFKILLHNPIEIPPMDQKYLIIPTNQDFTIAVKPEMTKTSSSLKAYDAAKRHCFFQDEKKLKFHQIYTAENCQIECVTNYTLSQCQCVAFYMPHFKGTPMCGSGKLNCLKQVAKIFRITEVIGEVTGEEALNEFGRTKCNCLPSCTSLFYNIETSQADFDWQEYLEVLPKRINNTAGMKVSRVTIFYKDSYFIPSYRSELYGQTDFIANCGGLLGLFMGFSFISVIEIIYFLTLRIWCNISVSNRKIWAIFKFKKSENTSPSNIQI